MYTKDNFKNCIFNPMIDTLMLETYPALGEVIKVEWVDEYLDSILRFVICVYDPKSPLLKDEPDLNHRKDIAADLAGMVLEIREAVFNFVHRTEPKTLETPSEAFIPELVFEYLRRFGKSKEFAAIVAVEFKFWEQIKQIITPITGKNSKEELEAVQKKSLVSNEIEIDLKRIDTYYSKFFGEDAVLQTKARNRFSPEKIAKAQ